MAGCCGTLVISSMSLDRFDREREIHAPNMGARANCAAILAWLAVDLDRLSRAAKKLPTVAIKNNVARPIAAHDVVLPLGPQNTRFSHQNNCVGVRLAAVIARDFQPGGTAENMRLAKSH